MAGVIGACNARVKVLKVIPKGAIVTVAEALQRLIRDAVDQDGMGEADVLRFLGFEMPTGGGGRAQAVSRHEGQAANDPVFGE